MAVPRFIALQWSVARFIALQSALQWSCAHCMPLNVSINNNSINYDYDNAHFKDDLMFDRLLWNDSSANTAAAAAAKNNNNINYDYDDENFKEDLMLIS